MKVSTLESRPLYSIGTVARLTGIKPDTLRVWERRYGLGASQKPAGGRREFTQSDLEHLQIVAALLEQGIRIGDIASQDRKTLQVMTKGRAQNGKQSLPKYNPRFLFIGEQLAHWIDEHPGCISNVSAFIARQSVQSALEIDFAAMESFDAVVVECSSLDSQTKQVLDTVKARTGAGHLIACHSKASEHWVQEMHRNNVTLLTLPPDPVSLGAEINRCVIEKTRSTGDANAGELVEAKPRHFSDQQLHQAANIDPTLNCACPNHISKLVAALNEFETYSSQCGVDNWHDAAVHACVYAYTNQARWLMEKALQSVLEEEGVTP
jgi:DNA-binding transcriptional MerR regulator